MHQESKNDSGTQKTVNRTNNTLQRYYERTSVPSAQNSIHSIHIQNSQHHHKKVRTKCSTTWQKTFNSISKAKWHMGRVLVKHPFNITSPNQRIKLQKYLMSLLNKPVTGKKTEGVYNNQDRAS
jgi:hypothetical protein